MFLEFDVKLLSKTSRIIRNINNAYSFFYARHLVSQEKLTPEEFNSKKFEYADADYQKFCLSKWPLEDTEEISGESILDHAFSVGSKKLSDQEQWHANSSKDYFVKWWFSPAVLMLWTPRQTRDLACIFANFSSKITEVTYAQYQFFLLPIIQERIKTTADLEKIVSLTQLVHELKGTRWLLSQEVHSKLSTITEFDDFTKTVSKVINPPEGINSASQLILWLEGCTAYRSSLPILGEQSSASDTEGKVPKIRISRDFICIAEASSARGEDYGSSKSLEHARLPVLPQPLEFIAIPNTPCVTPRAPIDAAANTESTLWAASRNLIVLAENNVPVAEEDARSHQRTSKGFWSSLFCCCRPTKAQITPVDSTDDDLVGQLVGHQDSP